MNNYEPRKRSLPKADITGFTPPEIIKSPRYSRDDLSLIRNIQNELVDSGVITSDIAMSEDTEQTLEELIAVLREANESAKSERDFNPDFYDENITEELEEQERELVEDFDNPALDGVDDYGNKVYDDMREVSEEGYFPHDFTPTVNEGKSGTVRVRLPDGTEVIGEIV